MVHKRNPVSPLPRQSRFISAVLSPAIRLWLRSQVESVHHLEFQIAGGDRQILAGHIPEVTIAAKKVVYQGIHLSQIALSAQEIYVNLPQILRGKPLQLQAIVPVEGKALLHQSDLNASLQAPLLANALQELLLPLLQSSLTDPTGTPWGDRLTQLRSAQAVIKDDCLILMTTLVADAQPVPFILRTGLQRLGGSGLRFDRPEWIAHLDADCGKPLPALEQFEINLGPEVDIQELAMRDQQIICQGRVNVIPASQESGSDTLLTDMLQG